MKKQNLSKELLAPERQKDHLPNATVATEMNFWFQKKESTERKACYVSHSELLEKLHRELAPHQVGLVRQ